MLEHLETEIKEHGAAIGYILEVHLTVTPADDLLAGFGELVDVVTEWAESRGELAVDLAIALIAPISLQETLLAYAIGVIQEHEPLRPFFQRIGGAGVYIGESAEEDMHEIQIPANRSEEEETV